MDYDTYSGLGSLFLDGETIYLEYNECKLKIELKVHHEDCKELLKERVDSIPNTASFKGKYTKLTLIDDVEVIDDEVSRILSIFAGGVLVVKGSDYKILEDVRHADLFNYLDGFPS